VDLQMRKPTIIEEMPDQEGMNEAPTVQGHNPDRRSARPPGSRPEQPDSGRPSGGRVRPSPAPEAPPAEGAPARRVPLGHSRRRA
jgi:hypothetical protein